MLSMQAFPEDSDYLPADPYCPLLRKACLKMQCAMFIMDEVSERKGVKIVITGHCGLTNNDAEKEAFDI